MHACYPARRFLLGTLALTVVTVTAAAEELYKYTPPPDKEHSTFAAIAYSEATGKWGYAYDRPTGQDARRAAVKLSIAEDAEVVVSAGNMWCALALGDAKDAYGVGTGSRESAEQLALRAARKVTTNCYVAVCVHSRYGKGR
jgi:hypothetical protein